MKYIFMDLQRHQLNISDTETIRNERKGIHVSEMNRQYCS